MPYLYAHLTTLRPDKLDDPPKAFDLFIFPDAQVIRRYPPFRRDSRHLCNDQPCPTHSPAAKMHKVPVSRYSVMGRILTHGRNDDTISQNDIPYSKGCK